jgi:hypothetical protein
MTARWFKHHHGMCGDEKWLMVAEASGVNRLAVSHIFERLCEHASAAGDRGSIAGFNPYPAAWWCQIPVELVGHVIEAMRGIGVIVGERLANWSKRQEDDTKRSRPRSKGALRTAKWRQNRGAASPSVTASPNVTSPSHVTAEETQKVPSSPPTGVDDREREGVCAREPDRDVEPEGRDPPLRPSEVEIDSEFDRLWSRWGNRENEVGARREYRARRRAGVAAEDIAQGVAFYALRRAGERPEFWKNLREWLRAGQWSDRLQSELVMPLAGGAAAGATIVEGGAYAATAGPTARAASNHGRRDRDADRAYRRAGLAAGMARFVATRDGAAGERDEGGDRRAAG